MVPTFAGVCLVLLIAYKHLNRRDRSRDVARVGSQHRVGAQARPWRVCRAGIRRGQIIQRPGFLKSIRLFYGCSYVVHQESTVAS